MLIQQERRLTFFPRCAACSINGHAARYRNMREIRHLHHIWLFILAFHLSIHNVRLKSMSKIRCAHNGVDDGEDDQNDCDHCERSKSLASRSVASGPVGVLIHPDELEKEVGHSSKIKNLSRAHVSKRLLRPSRRGLLTMVATMPEKLSFRVKNPAMIRMRIVTGIAAIVKANSISLTSTTTTTNWTVNPRKKKKSNLSRAI